MGTLYKKKVPSALAFWRVAVRQPTTVGSIIPSFDSEKLHLLRHHFRAHITLRISLIAQQVATNFIGHQEYGCTFFFSRNKELVLTQEKCLDVFSFTFHPEAGARSRPAIKHGVVRSEIYAYTAETCEWLPSIAPVFELLFLTTSKRMRELLFHSREIEAMQSLRNLVSELPLENVTKSFVHQNQNDIAVRILAIVK